MKFFSIVVLIFFRLISCINKDISQKNPVKILFLGESTTVGQGASSPNENYVTKTIEFLKQSGVTLEYKVIAKSGMSSTWGITRLDEIYSYSPDLIIIEFLINDQYLSLDSTKSNYEIFSKNMKTLIADNVLFTEFQDTRELFCLEKAKQFDFNVSLSCFKYINSILSQFSIKLSRQYLKN